MLSVLPLALLLSAQALESAPLPARIDAALKAMTRAYKPFQARPHKADLEPLRAAVEEAAAILKDCASLREEKARAAAGPEAQTTLLAIKAALEEAEDDRRDLQAALKEFVDRPSVQKFKLAMRRPYKDLYRKLETLKESFEALP